MRLTLIHPCIGRRRARRYIRSWQMEPLPGDDGAEQGRIQHVAIAEGIEPVADIVGAQAHRNAGGAKLVNEGDAARAGGAHAAILKEEVGFGHGGDGYSFANAREW